MKFLSIVYKYMRTNMIFDIAYCFPQFIYLVPYISLKGDEYINFVEEYISSKAFIILMSLRLLKVINLVRAFVTFESMRDALKRRYFQRRNMIQNFFMWCPSDWKTSG